MKTGADWAYCPVDLHSQWEGRQTFYLFILVGKYVSDTYDIPGTILAPRMWQRTKQKSFLPGTSILVGNKHTDKCILWPMAIMLKRKIQQVPEGERGERWEYVAQGGQARPLQLGYITDDEDVLNSLLLSLSPATVLASTLVLPGGDTINISNWSPPVLLRLQVSIPSSILNPEGPA